MTNARHAAGVFQKFSFASCPFWENVPCAEPNIATVLPSANFCTRYRVVRHHLEVSGPRRAKLLRALNAIAQRIDEFAIAAHESADGVGIARIDGVLKLQNYVERMRLGTSSFWSS